MLNIVKQLFSFPSSLSSAQPPPQIRFQLTLVHSINYIYLPLNKISCGVHIMHAN